MSGAGFNNPEMLALAKELAKEFSGGGKRGSHTRGKSDYKGSKPSRPPTQNQRSNVQTRSQARAQGREPPPLGEKRLPVPRAPRGPPPTLDIARLNAVKHLKGSNDKASDFLSGNESTSSQNRQALRSSSTAAMTTSVKTTAGPSVTRRNRTLTSHGEKSAVSKKSPGKGLSATHNVTHSNQSNVEATNPSPPNPYNLDQLATTKPNNARRELFAAKANLAAARSAETKDCVNAQNNHAAPTMIDQAYATQMKELKDLFRSKYAS